MTPFLLSLALAISAPAPAQAADPVHPAWSAMLLGDKISWVVRYHMALAGDWSAVQEVITAMATELGVSYAEAKAMLQAAAPQWFIGGTMPTPLLFIDVGNFSRGGALIETEDLTASMRVDLPGGESGQEGGSVEVDCLGGTDENGDDADCADDAIPTASVGDLNVTGVGLLCTAWLSDDLGVAADVECDAIPGDTFMASYVVVLED